MLKISLLSILFTIIVFKGVAKTDTLEFNAMHKKEFFRKQVLPGTLLTAGILLNIGQIKNQIQNSIPNTNTSVEDYLQYAPISEMYLFDIAGIKHQNSVFDQTKYLAISELVSGTLVHFLKQTTKVPRPFGERTSFPSGHTTNAFVGATVLYHEYKDSSPLIAYSGFVFATATGVLRITNNAHWLPDVLAGAGIGILTVNLVYYFEPLKNWQPFHTKKGDLAFTPIIGSNLVGLHLSF